MEIFVTSVKQVYEWSVERVDILKSNHRDKDALAISEEFKEWIQADYDDEAEVLVIQRCSEDDYFNHIND